VGPARFWFGSGGRPRPGQGEASLLERRLQAAVVSPPTIPGVPAHLGEGGQDAAVRVEGVGNEGSLKMHFYATVRERYRAQRCEP